MRMSPSLTRIRASLRRPRDAAAAEPGNLGSGWRTGCGHRAASVGRSRVAVARDHSEGSSDAGIRRSDQFAYESMRTSQHECIRPNPWPTEVGRTETMDTRRQCSIIDVNGLIQSSCLTRPPDLGKVGRCRPAGRATADRDRRDARARPAIARHARFARRIYVKANRSLIFCVAALLLAAGGCQASPGARRGRGHRR